MKYKIISLIFYIFSLSTVLAQIPVDDYRNEILNLKTENDINSYWKKLKEIDQEILVNLKDVEQLDSLSIDNMIRTALIFDIHGEIAYKPNNIVPILNMSHNSIGCSQIAFWKIIKKCANVGGVINRFGGEFPAYQLESVGLTFYHYSLLNQESLYPKLTEKLDSLTDNNVVENLLSAFEKQKKIYDLKEMEVLNEWYVQPSLNYKEKEKFALVLMSDNHIYLRKFNRIHKLSLIESKDKIKIYRIENEPFGWTYQYGSDGSLCLKDENGNYLIQYSKYNN